MSKRRILIPVDSRANWTRVQTVAESIQSHPSLELYLAPMSKFAHEWQIYVPPTLKPSNVLAVPYESDSLESIARQCSDIMVGLTSLITNTQPDLVLALTDRFETLITAYTSTLLNRHVAHIQGGELTGTIDESIRHAVTKLSHIHFPATDQAKNRIIGMSEDERYVFNVGCPASDLLLRVDVSEPLIPEPYILVLYHPVTTEYGESNCQMSQLIEGIQAVWNGQIVVVGPNHDAGNRGIWDAIKSYNLPAPHTVPFNEWVNLMANARVLVGNSSAGIREACYFGTPVVDIGTRQSNRYPRGHNTMWCNWDKVAVRDAVYRQLRMGRYEPEYLYGDGNAGKLIARVLGEVELPPIQKRFYE